MAIYRLFDNDDQERFTETFEEIDAAEETRAKGKLFSTLITRFCFLLLLAADCAWLAFNAFMLVLGTALFLLTGGKVKRLMARYALHFRRSALCALALAVGLFSPPFGIMIACTYFLMYDKAGMEEVVPATLQAQFKDIFRTDP